VGKTLLGQFPFNEEIERESKQNRQKDYDDDGIYEAQGSMDLNVNLAILYLCLQPKQNLLPAIDKFLPRKFSYNVYQTIILKYESVYMKNEKCSKNFL